MLVDLRKDAEGYIPLEVDYDSASPDHPPYDVIEEYPELASHCLSTARQRGKLLAGRLRLPYIAHHL